MADTRVQKEAENWVREHDLPARYGQEFEELKLQLTSGGSFEFDAVSKDGTIVASISTSKAKTAAGKFGSGKLMKLRSDMLFLLLVEAEHRILVFTEQDMFDLCQAQRDKGRVPEQIEFLRVELPPRLNQKLIAARKQASREVRPRRSRMPKA